MANRLISPIVYCCDSEIRGQERETCSGPHHAPCKLKPTDGEYHAEVLGCDDHGDTGQRDAGQFGVVCLSEVVEKYRRCAAVPIWMVGQESVARRLGS